jgi:long-chain acyl-CoA synthetase
VLENAEQLASLDGHFSAGDRARCRGVFLMDGEGAEGIEGWGPVLDFKRLLALPGDGTFERAMASLDSGRLHTIVYTSGTTGNPKGVMLSQANFLQNVAANTPRLEMDGAREETTVVMLPAWHVYERAFEYCAFTSGLQVVYSHAGRFAQDLIAERPHVLITVPRVWESIHQKFLKTLSEMPALKRGLLMLMIKANQVWLSAMLYLRGHYVSLKRRSAARRALAFLVRLGRAIALYPAHAIANAMFAPFRAKVGGRLRVATCGAGSLPKYLDELFNAVGITVVNAYGMTECAPGILSRTIKGNTFGSTGVPFDNTEVEIRHPDGSRAGIGERGIVHVRGPQVMAGYWRNPEATAAVLSQDGWLNTGDLAVLSENGEIIVTGRAKDTIVLMGGEYVEPEPLEDKLKESRYIDHAVVVGQDRKAVSAIVAVNEEELMRLAAELKLSVGEVDLDGPNSIENDAVYEVLRSEINSLISRHQGFKPFERIASILAVRNDFSIGKELTQTLKIKRAYVQERYRAFMDRLFGEKPEKGTPKKRLT